MCAFAAFGGIFFGYDSGYISGVMGMEYFIKVIAGPTATALPASTKSLITSILSAGTFLGAVVSGDLADFFGRRATIIAGCLIFMVGVILQTASQGLGLMVAGRLIAGLGVGFVSAIIILYMSEIAPKKVRGAIVSGYQFCITVGMLLASCVSYATENRTDSASYRIPIAIQFLWAIILAGGLFFLPESPRYFVKKGASFAPLTFSLAFVVSQKTLNLSRTSLPKSLPTTNTNCPSRLPVVTLHLGLLASLVVSATLGPTFEGLFSVHLSR